MTKNSSQKKRGRPAKARAGGRPALSHQLIVKTAVKLADKDGLERLSMRKLAQQLDVEAMSLYNYVKNKEGLIDGMLDVVVGEFLVPSRMQPWKVAMRDRAVSCHAVLLKHPWAALQVLSRINLGDSMMIWTEATIDCLHHAGFSYPQADHAWNAMDNHIYGFTIARLATPVQPKDYAQVAKEYLPQIDTDAYPNIHALASMISAGKHSGVNDFEFGLELILDGLENLLNE